MLFLNLSLGLCSSFLRGLFCWGHCPFYLLPFSPVFSFLLFPGGSCHFLFWLASISVPWWPIQTCCPSSWRCSFDFSHSSLTFRQPVFFLRVPCLVYFPLPILVPFKRTLYPHWSPRCLLDPVPLSFLTTSFQFSLHSFGTRKPRWVICCCVICDTWFCLPRSSQSAFFPVQFGSYQVVCQNNQKE